MFIERVSAVHFKGRTFNYTLTPRTLIHGTNFSGKTAIVEAIRLTLLGYIPEVGKQASATWELSSGQKMVTELDINGAAPRRLTREFWLEKTSVKQSMSQMPFDAATLPLLQADYYFGLSEQAQMDYVFAKIKLPDTYTVSAIISDCERLSLGEAHTEHVQIAKKSLIPKLTDCFEAPDVRSGDPSLVSVKPTIQLALSDALETCKTQFTYWNRRTKETQGAVTTLAELKLKEPGVVAAAQNIDQRLSEVQTTVDALNEDLGALRATTEAQNKRLARRQFIRGLLDSPAKRDYEADIKTAEGRITRLVGEMGVELGDKERAELVAKIKHIDARQTLTSTINEAARIIDEIAEKKRELDEIDACPYCKSKMEGWKGHLLKDYTAREKLAHREHDAAMETKSKLNAQIVELEGQLNASDVIRNQNANRRVTIDLLKKDIERYRSEKASSDAKRKELEAELAELEGYPGDKISHAESTTKREGELKTAKEKLTNLRADRDAEIRLKQDLKRAGEAETEHQLAAAHVLVIKEMATILKAKREAMVCEAFTGLLAIANRIVHGIMKADLALFENTIGMWTGDKFVPHRVFSGTEKALTYIAVAVALSTTAPFKLVILDELGRLDSKNQEKIIERLAECVSSGLIDQFVAVGANVGSRLTGGINDLYLSVIEV